MAIVVLAAVPAKHTVAAQDDTAWLRVHGTLLWHDRFDREEEGNLATAIGNGWTSATADRVPGVKQADLDEGVLKVITAEAAGHGAHIHHDAGFADGGAIVRFRLPGTNRRENLTVGFVDRDCPKLHAGHLCYAVLNESPSILVRDHKTGVSDLETRKRRDPFLKAKQPLPADLAALLVAKEKSLAWKPDNEWHELVIVTEGDELHLALDGEPLGGHRSPGFGHPVKRWFSLGVGTTAWIDDVKVYRVR